MIDREKMGMAFRYNRDKTCFFCFATSLTGENRYGCAGKITGSGARYGYTLSKKYEYQWPGGAEGGCHVIDDVLRPRDWEELSINKDLVRAFISY